ncbi:hypothetical protein JCM3770_001825 [Rhodotorula araucariae]
MAVHRDLYAGGERDAVRCRPTALDGLDEILDLAPPLAPSARRPSAPAATFSFATPSSAAAFGLVPLAQRPPRRHSVEPRLSALPPPPPLAAPALARLRPRARSVARKPVPRAGLEDDLELVVAPDRDSGHVEALAPALEPERVIEERVRRMSVEDAQVGCGLGIGLQSIPAAIDPFLPASPATPISLSSAASSSLSRSTTLSSTSASSASSSRPFALIRKHAPARPTHAHDIILGCAAPRASNRVDDELVDAWMDLIAGRGDVDGVQSRRPALFAPRAVPRASRAAPQPFAPDVLAHLANALPPLVYTAAPPSAPILLPAPTVPSPVSLARSPLQHTSSSPPSPTSPIPRVPATHPAPEHRHSLVAPSLHGSETASDEYYSAVEGDPSPEWSPPPAAPTPSAHRLHKRSLSILRAPDGHTLPPLRLSFVPDPSAPTAEPPISPTSPVQPEQKRRLVDTAAVWTLEGDKPLPQQRPPRPPKSAARRGSDRRDDMGKTGKAAKRRRIEQQAQQLAALPLPLDSDDANDDAPPDFLGGLVGPAQLAATVRTLETLSRHSELLQSKHDTPHLRPLRRAVFDFQRTAAELAGTGNSLSSRISAALTQHRHLDALVLLSELRIRQQHPKLGALQRWVRDCDAASRSDGSFGDEMVLRVLDAVLRCTNGEPEPGSEEGLLKGEKGQVVVRQREWVHREPSKDDIYAEIAAGRFPPSTERAALAAQFSLLHTVPAAERLPPNLHPALLFASAPGAIPLAPTPTTPVQRFEVPHVPGAFLLTDVLSQDECRSILAHAEAVEFRPDQPIEGDQSVLAHNLYWLADKPFLDAFCARFLHLCPQLIDGKRVRGINARFRVYRYVPGAIYRPHIDGAWPASGVDPDTGEYLYDSSPKDKPQWSRLTFLIYLNDRFTNGCTTFFLPSSVPSTLHAFPVKPSAGCALVFPHGDSHGSLLHEGSPVGPGGAKYVIRTEVLYDAYEVPVHDGVGGKEGERDEGVEV